MVTPQLPIPLDKLLDKAVAAYSETLTPDMVPLKAVYIQVFSRYYLSCFIFLSVSFG